MRTYTGADLKKIATAIGKEAADVVAHLNRFEVAASWFRLDRAQLDGSPSPRRTPSQLKPKLRQISKSARRLLGHLGVPYDESGRVRIGDAYDGPGDFDILEALSWAVDHDENPVVVATRRIGRLVEVIEAIEAANDLAQWAEYSAEEVAKFGELTAPKGHRGDTALNEWIAAMLLVYKMITGKDPATSVGAPGTDKEGAPGGPLLRFLEAAGAPLDLEFTPAAWRSRVRGLLEVDQN